MNTNQLKTKVIFDFTKKNKQLLDEWSRKAVQAFLEQSRKISQKKCVQEIYLWLMMDTMTHWSNQKYSRIYLRVQKRNENQISKKQREIYVQIENFIFYCQVIRDEKFTKSVFKTLREQVIEEFCYQQLNTQSKNEEDQLKLRLPRQVFTKWRKLAHNETILAILHQEYEQLIAQLENVLEKKLIELQVEEEHHKKRINIKI
ncbi:unnamed protein product (macronuclear) [Paramecium tetraurelia]|uniref:Uncharacterized protein n=1 Tax=Paramecium tetraurelia TaxID=5888 RepID=A0E152_PARTE|nr:uncharacterized protein GSPATT00022188001 [Paramecium tetraurelia]CAK89019.1 unnamed protein product [Paramecium tetraurelia]|eukprot:XP_001456416.1 hypothetical protein (macronuclear) [Paramecium tetraurelia strain d4-2]